MLRVMVELEEKKNVALSLGETIIASWNGQRRKVSTTSCWRYFGYKQDQYVEEEFITLPLANGALRPVNNITKDLGKR